MIIYLVDGGYGPGPEQMPGGFPPAAIVLLTMLLAWVISRALLVGTGKPVPQPGGPGWAPPPAGPMVVDPREVRRVRAEVDAEWTSYCMDPYSIFIRPLLDDVTEPATAGSSTAVNGWSSWRRWPKPQRRAWIAASSTSKRYSIWPTRGTPQTSTPGRSAPGGWTRTRNARCPGRDS